MPSKQKIKIIKIPLSQEEKSTDIPQVFPRLPRLYLELIENKAKIKQDLINKDYVPSKLYSHELGKESKAKYKNNFDERLDTLLKDNSYEKDKYVDKYKDDKYKDDKYKDDKYKDDKYKDDKYKDDKYKDDKYKDDKYKDDKYKDDKYKDDKYKDDKYDKYGDEKYIDKYEDDKYKDDKYKDDKDNKYKDDKYKDDKYGDDTYKDDKYKDDKDDKYGDDKYRDDKYKDDKYGDDKYRDDKYKDDKYGDDKYRDDKYKDNKYGDDKYRDDKYKDDKYGDDKYRDDKYGDDKYKDDILYKVDKYKKDDKSSVSNLSDRLNQLLNDDDANTVRSFNKKSAEEKYINPNSSENNTSQHKQFNNPPSLKELEAQGGIQIKKELANIDRISYNDQEEEDLKRELMFKIDLLKKSYPTSTIPEFNIYSDYSSMKKTYDTTVRKLSLDSTVDSYKTYLVGAFMCTEFVLGNFLKFDMQGFTQQQITSMNSYEKLLIELGEKSYIPGGSKWPVEIRLLGLVIINAAVFLVGKMIMKKTGANLLGMINNMNTSIPPPVKRKKMSGPTINLDEIPEIK